MTSLTRWNLQMELDQLVRMRAELFGRAHRFSSNDREFIDRTNRRIIELKIELAKEDTDDD